MVSYRLGRLPRLKVIFGWHLPCRCVSSVQIIPLVEPSLLLQIATTTSTTTTGGSFNTAGAVFNLFVEIIGSIITIADAISELLYIAFTAAGLQMPLVVWRVVTIVIGVLSFWRFLGSMTWSIKILIAIVLISMVSSLFIGSGFGGGILANPFKNLGG